LEGLKSRNQGVTKSPLCPKTRDHPLKFFDNQQAYKLNNKESFKGEINFTILCPLIKI
jgi:hypothetical protein